MGGALAIGLGIVVASRLVILCLGVLIMHSSDKSVFRGGYECLEVVIQCLEVVIMHSSDKV